MKHKVLVPRATFPDVIERLKSHVDVEYNETDIPFAPDELRRRMADKTGALLLGTDRIDQALINGAPYLRAVSNASVGYDNFDLPAMTRASIVATNAPNLSNESVADLAWGLLIAASRRMIESDQLVRSGSWRGFAYDLMLGMDLHRSTLGIVGMGRIGQAIARRAAGFDMNVLYHNRTRLTPEIEKQSRACHVSLDTLLGEADHVILTLPYSVQTHHLIGAPQLARMKRSATLVNIARGGVVDDAALAQALVAGTIAAAGLDVFENEPAVHRELQRAPHLVMTPHTGSATIATRRANAHHAVDNLLAALDLGPYAGRPPSVLNPEVLDG
ncbi:D-glycerate dehydrogenase [Burkholderia sp. Ac-20365]|uniref:2-hydroxyacid dehydrogenase n=1 Tax=Burkholderia sp. Ac-20365 TaxID=2703897 RepID=UPI00197C897D|nr:D-glycerate dehydrogenase [Burkholderia sp. Ac-20365]MBN3760491.1 D-glycerate dehydrogenase [Burkholderia sp. Ac-20365]